MFGLNSGLPATIAGEPQSILSGMRLARVLGVIGRGLISLGVIILLFVAYQLWGTGIQNAAAQTNLGNDFAESTGIEADASDAASLTELARASQEAIEDGQILIGDTGAVLGGTEARRDAADSEGSTSTPEAPGTAATELFENNFDEAERQQILAKLYPESGEAFARIIIPAINVDQISVEGVSVEDLRKGPGHYPTTPNPGQAGNAAIAGHRTTYGAPFHRLDELNPGDPIFVTTAQGVFEYQVLGFEDPGGGPERGYFVVRPIDTWVLDQKDGQNILTLTACHPKYSSRQRIIVQAELVGDPAPTIPRDEATEFGAVTLDSGAADERTAKGVDREISGAEQVIIGDDVAADDDPSVDGDGNPVDADTDDTTAGSTASQDDPAPQGNATSDANPVDAGTDETTDLSEDDAEPTSAQTSFSTDDFGEGLNGDPTKLKPAILWGASGLFIWFTAWFIGKRLDRKWTLYALGLLPFIVVLWSTFVNIDQALPSY
jgi:sortase A